MRDDRPIWRFDDAFRYIYYPASGALVETLGEPSESGLCDQLGPSFQHNGALFPGGVASLSPYGGLALPWEVGLFSLARVEFP